MIRTKDVQTIVTEWLIAHGYDGLCGEGCGCRLADLMPCSQPSPGCMAGYESKCVCGDGCDFDMVLERPDKAP